MIRGLRRMQEGLRAQENTGRFPGSEVYRKVLGLRRMQNDLRAQKDAGRFEGPECRKS